MRFPSARALHRLVIRVTQAGASVFAWIFLFQYFYVRSGSMAQAVSSLAFVYALAQVTSVLLTPWAAARLRHGFRRLIVYAVLLLATSYAVLAASFAGYLGSFGWGIGLFAVLFGAYRALYWVPYEFSKSLAPSKSMHFSEVFVALAPAAAGLVLTISLIAPIGLLALASGLSILSLLPVAGMRETQEGFSWGYRQTFHELFAYRRLHMTLVAMADGLEASILLLFWPLVIFILLSWSYPMVGIVLSATYLITIALRRFLVRLLGKISAPISALMAASAWIIRLTVGNAFGIVMVDTYFYVGSRSQKRGIDMGAFEQAADSSTFIDEHTALKEMGMAIGRILMCLTIGLLVLYTSLPMTFVVAFSLAAIAAAYSAFHSHA